MPKSLEVRQRGNRLREILDENGLVIQDLTALRPIGGATIANVLKRDYYPGDVARANILEALSQATHRAYTEEDVWPIDDTE